MVHFCIYCGAQMPDNAAVCPACGKAMPQSIGTGTAAAAPATATVGGMAENIAGMVAYITFIPAIIFLLVEPYNRNRFVRFHSFQCIALSVALFVVHIAVLMVPVFGLLVSMVVNVGAFILWLLCLLKAYQGFMWKIPVLGDFAEKQANV